MLSANRAVIPSEDLKGTVEPNVLYSVELKPMHKAKGYVVVAAMNYSLVVSVYHCLSNIWALFEPQLRKTLIINNFYILHRQVKN